MAIFAGVFALIGRQAGRFLTAALGWASTLLFGRVPQSRQVILAIMTLGSIAWVAMLLGVVIPEVGTLLLGFVSIPDFIDERWVRLGMLLAALITPLLIGLGGLLIPDPPDRPKGVEAAKQVLRGYPLAFLLAFTLVFLAVVGTIRKARSLVKRWTDAHVPIVVRTGGYGKMVDDLEDALDQAGLKVDEKPAPTILSTPARLVALVAGGGIRAYVPDQLTMLVAKDIEISLYPSDIAISGQKATVARARAAIATRLAATSAHLTTTREAQEIEDRLQGVADSPPIAGLDGAPVVTPDVAAELQAVDRALSTIDIDYDEWEVLYRVRLQVERDLLLGHAPGEDIPGAPTAPVPEPPAERGGGSRPVLAIAGIVLMVVDVGLAIAERFRPPTPRA